MFARNMNTNNGPRPLQASTNIIHTKIPKRIDNVIHQRAKLSEKEPLRATGAPLKKDLTSTNKKIIKKLDSKSSQSSKVDENDIAHFKTEKDLKPASSSPVKATTDENDLSEYVKKAYNPLDDIHPFDEELYQRILKLELADDGLPKFDSDEPFDF